jgi:PKD repeat protein
MNWERIADSDLLGYKVVISKNNPNPAYPGDGYMFWITNRDTTTATITSESHYNGGDFGGYLEPGETYYFSVTALYQPYTPVAGNAVQLAFPGGMTPVVLPGESNAPTDPDGDGLYEDLNGNSEAGFSDVVLFFKNLDWIADNEPVSAFDFNGNGEIGFQDIVLLFGEL